jgi:hypothetical protein
MVALVGLVMLGASMAAAQEGCCNCEDSSKPLVPPVAGLDFANVCLPATGPAPTCADHSDPIDHCGEVNQGWACRQDARIGMLACQPPLGPAAPALSPISLAGLGLLLVVGGIWLTRKRTRAAL